TPRRSAGRAQGWVAGGPGGGLRTARRWQPAALIRGGTSCCCRRRRASPGAGWRGASRGENRWARGCPRRSRSTSPNTISTGIIELLAERTRRLTPLQLARLLRGAAAEKKAWDPVVIDVRDQTSVADYFVICEGETDPQVRAIAAGS